MQDGGNTDDIVNLRRMDYKNSNLRKTERMSNVFRMNSECISQRRPFKRTYVN